MSLLYRPLPALCIIYGPEYTAPDNLSRLRSRGLSAKRGLTMREFALGIDALKRFVQGEPLRQVHECVFGALALESEPVDPRFREQTCFSKDDTIAKRYALGLF